MYKTTFLSFCILLSSCDYLAKRNNLTKDSTETHLVHSPKIISTLVHDSTINKTNAPKPIMGYRFVIEGDFDGDGKREHLIEKYISGITNKETNKFYENISEYSELIEQMSKSNNRSILSSNNKMIDTFLVSTHPQFGLFF